VRFSSVQIAAALSCSKLLPAEFRNPSWANLFEVSDLARAEDTSLWRTESPTVELQRISILGTEPPPLFVKCSLWIWNCRPTVLVWSPWASVSSGPSRYSDTKFSTWNNEICCFKGHFDVCQAAKQENLHRLNSQQPPLNYRPSQPDKVVLKVNNSHTYLLTYFRVHLEKLTGYQLVKKFPTFYGTPQFITAFISARHLSLS
jgi:hypothetical protein